MGWFYGLGGGVSLHNLLDTDAIDNLKLELVTDRLVTSQKFLHLITEICSCW